MHDNHRDCRLCELHDVSAEELSLQVNGASVSITADLLGKEQMTPDDMDVDKALSHGIFCCCLLQ